MSQQTRVMWFGSIMGGFVLLLFSAIGISQFCKNVDMMPKPDQDKQKQ